MNALEHLTERAQREISDALYENAKVNEAAAGGLLKAYPPDLDRFPYQSLSIRPDHYRVKGNPLPPNEALGVLALVDGRTQGLEEALHEDEGLRAASSVLRSGQNAVFGTDHAELIDIAVFGVGASAKLHQQHAERQESEKQGSGHRSAIIVSKIVDFLGVDTTSFDFPAEIIDEFLGNLGLTIQADRTVPVRDFLALGFDYQFLSIPNSQSFTDIRKVQGDAIAGHNWELKKYMQISMSRRGIRRRPPIALYAAMSGTKNKDLDIETYSLGSQIQGNYATIPEDFSVETGNSVEVIGRISSNVTEFMSNALAFASAVRLEKGKPPRVRIDERAIALQDDVDVHQFGGRLAVIATELDGHQRIYDKKGNLPLLKAA